VDKCFVTVVAWVVVLAFSALQVAHAAALSDQEIRQATQKIFTSDSYQTKLPSDPIPRDRRAARRIPDRNADANDEPEPSFELPERDQPQNSEPQNIEPFSRAVFWGIVAVLVILLGAYLVRERTYLMRRGRSPMHKEPKRPLENSENPVVSDGHTPVKETDLLADEGRFGEAIRILVLKSIEDIRVRLRLSISPALTFREILGRTTLPEDAHAALQSLVFAEERSYFGRHMPDAADYQRCRQDFLDYFANPKKPG